MNGLSYAKSGVDIDATDSIKESMKESVNTADPSVLNTMGAFASLVEGRFEGYEHPILVLKTEEPGSKQKLAFQSGRISSVAYDLINHLINDIMVMGAKPVYVQDCIICGKIESETIKNLVKNMAEACREQGCVLTGGETSIQPGVVAEGEYVLSASGIGVVEKNRIIDGARIEPDDVVLAVASNGLHTNGYTLIRKLLEIKPGLKDKKIGAETFFEIIMRPHKCYYNSIKDLFAHTGLKGLAHITGGGIQDNLNRILLGPMDAIINLENLRIPEIFKVVRDEGNISHREMLRTFNMGVGLIVVCSPENQSEIAAHLKGNECESYDLGNIVDGSKKVRFEGSLNW